MFAYVPVGLLTLRFQQALGYYDLVISGRGCGLVPLHL